MLDIHFLWSRAQLRQALFCILYWDLLGLVTDTEKMVLSLSSGVTRIRRWWRSTRLPPTLGINFAIVFALPARPSCHPSHVFIYCEQFYNSQPLCCHLLDNVFNLTFKWNIHWGMTPSWPNFGCWHLTVKRFQFCFFFHWNINENVC